MYLKKDYFKHLDQFFLQLHLYGLIYIVTRERCERHGTLVDCSEADGNIGPVSPRSESCKSPDYIGSSI
jgi:hypothetical protein